MRLVAMAVLSGSNLGIYKVELISVRDGKVYDCEICGLNNWKK